MKITFVGTGSGKTDPRRFSSSLFVKQNKVNLLIDAGDGIQYALLKSGINPNKIRNIIITHFHADHFSGIFSLLTQMKLTGRTLPVNILLHESLVNNFKTVLNNFYLFPEKMSFEFCIKPLENGKPYFPEESFSLTTFRNSHINSARYPAGYESVVFYSCSLLIGTKNKKVFYTSDLGSVNDFEQFAEMKPDILISETTHISTDDLLKLFEFMQPGKMYLTHLDKDQIQNLKNWRKELTSKIKSNIVFAKEGLII